MKGKITSLNASVSAGIVIYEALKQKSLEDLQKQFDVYKAKMESLLISQLELIKEINKDNE